MKTIMVLNGPNLNLLGKRQPQIYGDETLDDVALVCEAACAEGYGIRLLQSNHEGQIIDWIHEARETACGIVINPGAFTHTSVAILDALNTYEPPVIEIHISQVHKREAFRHHSYVSHRADGVIAGLGIEGYAAGVRRICQLSADGIGARK
jgi:3-dehydroquinate dehydratase-2